MIWHLVAGALAMLALSAIFICWPRRASAQNNQTPAQLFEERLQLLVLARDAGELAEQDFASAASELKQQFLEQEQQAVRYQQPRHKALFHLSLVLVAAVIVALTYSQNGHYRQLTDWEYAQQNLPAFGQRALLGEGAPMEERDMQLFSLALRTKLANEGDDAVAWMLLGRVWMTLGMLEEAIESFERALKLMPERTPLLISYSQALIMLGGDLNLAKAGQSVAQSLEQTLQASGLAGHYQLQAGEAGAWQLTFDAAPADAVLDWLLSNPAQHSLQVVEARLQRADNPSTEVTAGTLSGTVRMDQALGAKEAS